MHKKPSQATLGIQKEILRMRNSSHGLASHDSSNTNKVLGAIPGAIPGIESDKNRCYACKREERKRERERERERTRERTRKGKGEGSRPRQKENRRERTQKKQMLRRTCLRRPRWSCGQAQRRREKKPRPTPRGERGKKKEEEKRRRTGPGNNSPGGPKTAKKELPYSREKSIQKRTPKTNEHTATTKHGARCTKPSGKTRRNKNRTPKPKLRKGELFSSPFAGRKVGIKKNFFGAKNPPRKTPDSHSRARGEKPSEKT